MDADAEPAPAAAGESPACRSCGAELAGEWCHACGQGHRHVRLSARELTQDVVEDLVALDTRFLRTLRALSLEPGRICRDFIAGRRVPWTHPVKYALFTAAFAFLVQRGFFALQEPPELAAEAVAMELQAQYGQLLNFLLMPVMAGSMRLLFPRVGLRWIEHLVVVVYGVGHLFLVQACFMPLFLVGGRVEAVAGIVVGLLPIAYFSWLAVETWGSRWWTAVPRVLLMWVVTNGLLNAVVQLVYFLATGQALLRGG